MLLGNFVTTIYPLNRHPIKIMDAQHTPNEVVSVRGTEGLSILLTKKSVELWCNHNVLLLLLLNIIILISIIIIIIILISSPTFGLSIAITLLY